MTSAPINTLSVKERRESGRAARKQVPRSSHAAWDPSSDRPDAVRLIEEQNDDRLGWLVPVRRGRMVVSPFTFYRGAARIMATDLAGTPNSGFETQICGDGHLSNFGVYASPERQLVFDANDFDETLDGPWEWDVKRLAASFMIAGQHREFPGATCAELTETSVRAYREAMLSFAEMRTLDLWYEHLTSDQINRLDQQVDKSDRKMLTKIETKAKSKDSLQALKKLAVEIDGHYRIRSDPPVLLPLRDLPEELRPDVMEQVVVEAFEAYKTTLNDDRRRLIERFHIVDMAVKVVGVGSVGTRCLIVLLEGRDRDDPLFLQVKEAGSSVLEEHLPKSDYDNHGRRVVEGQRSMQAVSDIFLGWTQGREGRQFYVRQLHDWKGSMDTEVATAHQMLVYAHLCGWTLARGHARTGDPVALAAYLGAGNTFDKAITQFSTAYAAQNQADFSAFKSQIDAGELAADFEA
jgi:uncharacterized protein (DUF2252 family)